MYIKHTIVLSIVVALSAACGSSVPAVENQNSVSPASTTMVKTPAPEKTPSGAATPISPQTANVAPGNSSGQPARKESAQTENGAGSGAADFDKIKPGMSYAEVSGIMGSAGEDAGAFKTQNGSMAMYRWRGRSGTGEWIVSAQFENGKLSNKSQFGLK